MLWSKWGGGVTPTGETWYFNENPAWTGMPDITPSHFPPIPGEAKYGFEDVPYKSIGTEFIGLTANQQYDTAGYYRLVCYGSVTAGIERTSYTTWTDEAYRAITLDEPATGDFLEWLEANAVKQ